MICGSSCRRRRLVPTFGGCVGFRLVVLAAEELQTRSIFRREFRSFGEFFDRSRRGHFGEQLDAAIVLETSARRDEPAHDDVFLQAAEIINLSGNGGFGKNTRGFLEAGGRDEGVCGKRRLGDTKEQRTSGCGTATF